MELSQGVYANVGATAHNTAPSGEGIYMNKSNVEALWNRNNQQPAKSGGRCYRVTAVCAVVLCVLLLVAVIVLGIMYINLSTENNQLQTSCKSLDMIDTRAKLGWRYFNTSFYYISADDKNWTESKEDCIERGAKLVIIKSTEEQEFIIKQLDRGQAWIGLSESYSGTERVWKWVDGTNLTNSTAYWHEGEPNNRGGKEDCGEIWVYPNKTGWNDRSCSPKQKWICEKSAF